MSEKKVINGRPIRLVRVDTIERCEGCHILFVGADEQSKFPDVLDKLRHSNTLTVGESDDFLERGGMIQLTRRDRHVALEVDTEPICEAGLTISSKLLSVAVIKGGKK